MSDQKKAKAFKGIWNGGNSAYLAFSENAVQVAHDKLFML